MSIRDKMRELEGRCPGTEFLWEGKDAAQVELRFTAPSQHGHIREYRVDLLELGMSAEEWLDAEIARWRRPDPGRDAAYGVVCPVHGKVAIGYNNYRAQMTFADEPWHCPLCGCIAEFDEDRLDAFKERKTAQLSGGQT